MNQHAVCMDIKQDVAGVKTFCFKPNENLSFSAGQFITLSLPTDKGSIQRSYTLSSSPKNNSTFSITVRKVPNGKGSHWLHQHLQPGTKIEFNGPYGRFVPDEFEQKKLLLLAAGSGITPFLSTFRGWRDRGISVDALLIFSVRNPGQIIEYQELKSLCYSIKGLSIIFMPENVEQQSWYGIRGRLDALWLPSLCRDITKREIFTCGPTPYMQTIKQYLQDTDIGLANYHEEVFLSPQQVSIVLSATEQESNKFTVYFENSDIKVSCHDQETLLDVAENAGMSIKMACRSGICGSCMTMKKSGSVDMQDLGGILPAEKNKGMILLCCSKPASDIVLDI
ncbi:MAG: ferredoxin-NADP reductase [Candidatus Endobugula sp.]|jgi:ferredoxin-NADP reductase